jgi:transcriptional regulator with XRE-family HTH domain
MKLYWYKDRCNISGIKIHERRTEAGLSQEQLAVRLQLAGLSLTQRQISRIEIGKRLVADYELIFFARVFGTTADYLLADS